METSKRFRINLRRLGERREARQTTCAQPTQHPTSPGAGRAHWYRLAKAQRRCGRHDHAMGALKCAIDKSPDDGQLRAVAEKWARGGSEEEPKTVEACLAMVPAQAGPSGAAALIHAAVRGRQREAHVAQVDVPAARLRVDGLLGRRGVAHVAAHQEASAAHQLARLAVGALVEVPGAARHHRAHHQ
mgnify:CR=1 FL=1